MFAIFILCYKWQQRDEVLGVGDAMTLLVHKYVYTY